MGGCLSAQDASPHAGSYHAASPPAGSYHGASPHPGAYAPPAGYGSGYGAGYGAGYGVDHADIPTGFAVPDPTPQVAEILNVTCGHCGNIVQMQYDPTHSGEHRFTCPFCGATNSVFSHGRHEFKITNWPDWWQKVPPELSETQSELLPANNKQIQMIQALIDRTWKDVTTRDRKYSKVPRLKVLQVQQNHNAVLWRNYCRAREQVRQKMKPEYQMTSLTTEVQKHDNHLFDVIGDEDVEVNEFLLFHGTKPAACKSICQSDFMISMAGGNVGTLYGKGIYFGENSSKSDEYAYEGEDIYAGMCAMLLCRVTCGRMYYTEDVKPDHDEIMDACVGQDPDYHSVLGDRIKTRGTYREFVLFNNDQAYPEYVILYRREAVE